MTKEGDYIVRRKTYTFRKRRIIEVEEFHDGRYGHPGGKRKPRGKPTPEQAAIINHQNKVKRCRHKLLEYFSPGDTFITLTYEKRNRPPTMKEAIAHFGKFIRKVKAEYRKRGQELRWIRNIEQGTKGAWHIHLVVNEIGDTASIIKRVWEKGGIYAEQIRLSDKIYDEDFSKLAAYMTKDEKEAITHPIETAKETISNLAEKIKGIFEKLKIKLPDIKLPHFKISGGEAPWGIAGKGTKPTVDVEWYRAGAVLKRATQFGTSPSGTPMVGGEAGYEAIAPINVLQGYVAEAVEAAGGTGQIDYDLLGEATAKACARMNITINLNGREIGRLERRPV